MASAPRRKDDGNLVLTFDESQPGRIAFHEVGGEGRLAPIGAAGASASGALANSVAEHAAMLEMFERRRRLWAIAVPTDDTRVRRKLREFGEPITLFGEGPVERRDRLRTYLYDQECAGVILKAFDDGEEEDGGDGEEEIEDYWTPGHADLFTVRVQIAHFSLRRAQCRLEAEARAFEAQQAKGDLFLNDLRKSLRTWTIRCSQLADDRPTSCVALDPTSTILATGSFGGALKLWNVPSYNQMATLIGHSDRVGGVAWMSAAKFNTFPRLVSGSADGTLCLWSPSDATDEVANISSTSVMRGHTARICRVVWHPNNEHVLSASADGTWRLWDAEAGQLLLSQDAHVPPGFNGSTGSAAAVAVHPDGSLVASAGSGDKLVRVWDLRTGRAVLCLRGHSRDVLALDFAPTGACLASGALDNSVKIWDLRALRSAHTIPAHTSLISQIRYYKCWDDSTLSRGTAAHGAGAFLATAGFDGKLNIWSTAGYGLLRSLKGHEGKIMDLDIGNNMQFIATAGYDRTFKIWGPEKIEVDAEP